MKTIDIHCHPSLKVFLMGKHIYQRHHPFKDVDPLGMHTDLFALQKGGIKAATSVHYLPEIGLYNSSGLNFIKYIFHFILKKFENRFVPEKPFRQLTEMMDKFENDVEEAHKNGFPDVLIARSFAEFEENWQNPLKTVYVHSIEGAHSLGYKLKEERYMEIIDLLALKGVCQFTIAHFFQNDVVSSGGGMPPSLFKTLKLLLPKPAFTGLNPNNLLGENIVHKLLDVGILIDLVHCPVEARERIYELNKERQAEGKPLRPLLFSHTGIRECIQTTDMPESDKLCLPDEREVKLIIESDGLIGVIFMNYWLNGHEEDNFFHTDNGLNSVIETIKKIRGFSGGSCDYIALGTDFDGFTQTPDDLVTSADIPKVWQRLQAEGFTEEDIEKIAYKNYLRVLKKGWGK